MDALQAAVLRVKAPHLAAWTEARRRNARALRPRCLAKPASSIASAARRAARLPAHLQSVRHPDAATATGSSGISTSRRIGNEIYYPVPLHLQPCFADPWLPRRRLSRTPSVRPTRALPFPSTASSTLEQQQAVVDAVAEFVRCRREIRSAVGPDDDSPPAAGLTTQILIGLLLGVAGRLLVAQWASACRPLADAFLRLIKMIIAPLVFSTLVVGIAGAGDCQGDGTDRAEGDRVLRDRYDRCARSLALAW